MGDVLEDRVLGGVVDVPTSDCGVVVPKFRGGWEGSATSLVLVNYESAHRAVVRDVRGGGHNLNKELDCDYLNLRSYASH